MDDSHNYFANSTALHSPSPPPLHRQMEQLSAGGIRVISCTKLPRKEKWQEKFSAFRVVVDIEDKDNVFNEELWLKGVEG